MRQPIRSKNIDPWIYDQKNLLCIKYSFLNLEVSKVFRLDNDKSLRPIVGLVNLESHYRPTKSKNFTCIWKQSCKSFQNNFFKSRLHIAEWRNPTKEYRELIKMKGQSTRGFLVSFFTWEKKRNAQPARR